MKKPAKKHIINDDGDISRARRERNTKFLFISIGRSGLERQWNEEKKRGAQVDIP